MNIIETHGLGKRYRRTWALRDCTLAIPAGSVVALVGHNGAGKTTLLNLLVGLIEPTEGAASLLGGEPQARPRRWTPWATWPRRLRCTRTSPSARRSG